MKFVGKEDGPGIGRPPQDGLIVVVPGKDAVPIGFEQSFGSQVAADGEQTIVWLPSVAPRGPDYLGPG